MSTAAPSAEYDRWLAAEIDRDRWYPDRLVMLLWRWGDGELAGIEEPDAWQMQDLREFGEEMRARNWNGVDSVQKILMAIGSGRGIGKSADISMIAVILLAAFPDAKITVMANSGDQLATKTWPEIRKWLRRSLVAHWFDANSSIIYRLGARDSWYAVPITWNLENPQASAGQQNLGSVNVMIFDECSEIPDKILEVALSGLTTGLPIALARGNPTMATGVFADSLDHKYAFGSWKARSIDARTCRFPNKDEIAEAVAVYGEDSDYVRVWIRGLPPKSNASAYFGKQLIEESFVNRPQGTIYDALILGQDFAWGGDDNNVGRFRHGLDAWSIPPVIIPGEKTQKPEWMIGVLSEILTTRYRMPGGFEKEVDMVFMDAAGISGPVATALRALGFGHRIIEVNFNADSTDPQYRNARAMMIGRTKLRMQQGLGLERSESLARDMRETQPALYVPLQFEKKELIKKRLKRSPDDLDALCLTEYAPVITKAAQQARQATKRPPSYHRGMPGSSYMG